MIYAGTFLAAVAVGMCIPSWLDRRRAARRLAAAESAFWVSLRGVVDRAEAERQAAPLPQRKPGGSIYAAADARLCGRLRAELDDPAKVDAWLSGGAR